MPRPVLGLARSGPAGELDEAVQFAGMVWAHRGRGGSGVAAEKPHQNAGQAARDLLWCAVLGVEFDCWVCDRR